MLYFPGNEIKQISLLSTLGSTVQTIKTDRKSINLDCSNLKPGLYFIRVETDEGVTGVRKMIRE